MMRLARARARVTLLVIGLLGALLAGCSRDPEAEMARAGVSFAAGDLRTAMIRVSSVLEEQPGHVAARVLRGRILLAVGDVSGARQDLERARADGAAADTVPLLADALTRVGEHDAALLVLEAIPEAERSGDVWRIAADALVRARRLDEAALALDRAAQAGAAASPLLLARGRFAVAGGDAQGADRFLSEAVDAASERHDRIEALVARGEHYLRTERYEAAVSDYAAAANLSVEDMPAPREALALSGVVQTEIALNDVAAAGQWANRLAERFPSSLASEYASALVAYENGQFEEAVARLQAVNASAAGNRMVLTLLAAAQLAKGDIFQAEQHLLGVLAAAPGDPAAVKLLAETRLRQQRPEAALEALRPLANLTTDAQVSALQGIASLQAGNVEQAIAFLEQAVAISPGDEALRLELARAYLAAGRTGAATTLLDGFQTGDASMAERSALVTTLLQASDVDGARAAAADIVRDFPDAPRARLNAAVVDLLAGERESAIEQLLEAVRLDGSFAQARIVLSGALKDAGREAEAEQQLREVLAIDPGSPTAIAGLADLALARGAVDEARSFLVDAVQAAPSPALRLALARIYLREGDLGAAQAQVDEAAREAPEDFNVLAVRGILALASGRAAEAVEQLTAVRARVPARLDIALALAQAQAAAGDLRASRDTLRDALRLAPQALPLRAALAAAEIRIGDARAATQIARALQVDFPRQPVGYAVEAQILIGQRRYEEAAASYERAFAIAPTWEVLVQWLTAFQLAGADARAESLVRDWLADEPEHVPARMFLARILQSSGRGDEALQEYERVLVIAPNDVPALNNAAWLAHERGIPGALARAERARELAPDTPPVLDTLGWILVGEGRGEEGARYLEQAAAAAPDAADIQYHYAAALARLGNSRAARDLLSALLDKNEPFATRAEAEALLRSL